MRLSIKTILVIASIGILAAVAIPNYIKARSTSSLSGCLDVNLYTIAEAKLRWAADYGKAPGSVPQEKDLLPYLPLNQMPSCHVHGIYSIGALGTDPACSFNHGK